MVLTGITLCLSVSRFGISKSNGFWRNGITDPEHLEFTESDSLILPVRKCGFLVVSLLTGTGRSHGKVIVAFKFSRQL